MLSYLAPSAALLSYCNDFNFPGEPAAHFARLHNLLPLASVLARIALFDFSIGNNGAACFCTSLPLATRCGRRVGVCVCAASEVKLANEMCGRRIAVTILLFTFLNIFVTFRRHLCFCCVALSFVHLLLISAYPFTVGGSYIFFIKNLYTNPYRNRRR